MRIAVYDNNWQPPKFSVTLKRSFLTATYGFVLFLKSKSPSGKIISVLDWEREEIGTMVIDTKVFRELKDIATKQNGDFCQNMTELYKAYLRDLYLK